MYMYRLIGTYTVVNVLLSVRLPTICVTFSRPTQLLETGVRTAIVRPTSKCFSIHTGIELVGVPSYLS